MLRLNNLKSPKGAHRNIKRIGRGQGSGQGKQAGKGHKGQKARAGGGVRTLFEGGNLPLYMKLPKRGFKNQPFKKEYAIFKLDFLEKKLGDQVISKEVLQKNGLLKGADKHREVKVLSGEEVKTPLVFKGITKFSKTAAEQLQKAGGKIES